MKRTTADVEPSPDGISSGAEAGFLGDCDRTEDLPVQPSSSGTNRSIGDTPKRGRWCYGSFATADTTNPHGGDQTKADFAHSPLFESTTKGVPSSAGTGVTDEDRSSRSVSKRRRCLYRPLDPDGTYSAIDMHTTSRKNETTTGCIPPAEFESTSHQKQLCPDTKESGQFNEWESGQFNEWKLKNLENWIEMHKRLVVYKLKHNNTRVPLGYKEDPKLAKWVQKQRRSCKEKNRIDLLNEIGFEWNAHNDAWMIMYNRLVAHKQKHNTTRVPFRYKADPKLALWVRNQRRDCKDKDRIDLLNEIGFEWKLRKNEDWMVMYNRLVAYKQKHNTTRVPFGYKDDPKLSKWVRKQRTCCTDKDCIDLLNEIGFVWKLKETGSDWMGMYKRLVAYKEKHNSTRVPFRYKEDPTLGTWVSNQRCKCKDKDRIDLLNKIGFERRVHQVHQIDDWMVMYERLVAYKQKHNTTRVRRGYKEDTKLANWVAIQRKYCKDKKHIDLLNKIGFEWIVSWMEMYNRLVAYKQKNNSTRVPFGYKEDPKLANWVAWQRKTCKDNKRIDLLNEIGFVWVARGSRKSIII